MIEYIDPDNRDNDLPNRPIRRLTMNIDLRSKKYISSKFDDFTSEDQIDEIILTTKGDKISDLKFISFKAKDRVPELYLYNLPSRRIFDPRRGNSEGQVLFSVKVRKTPDPENIEDYPKLNQNIQKYEEMLDQIQEEKEKFRRKKVTLSLKEYLASLQPPVRLIIHHSYFFILLINHFEDRT